MEKNSRQCFKVVVVGESGVGKSAVIDMYCNNKFAESKNPTIGSGHFAKTVQTEKGSINLSLWDTAGQERFQSMIPMYIRGAKACILVVDLTAKVCLNELSIYYDFLIENIEKNCVFILCGNKSDLLDIDTVSTQYKGWASSRSMNYFKVSAKTGEYIDTMFLYTCEQLLEKAKSSDVAITQTEIEVKTESKSCC